jgi:hypothetical protein
VQSLCLGGGRCSEKLLDLVLGMRIILLLRYVLWKLYLRWTKPVLNHVESLPLQCVSYVEHSIFAVAALVKRLVMLLRSWGGDVGSVIRYLNM